MSNDLIKLKIKDILHGPQEKGRREQALTHLLADAGMLPAGATLQYCYCGHPVKFLLAEEENILCEILREEANFDHFMLEYYCPECEHFVGELYGS